MTQMDDRYRPAFHFTPPTGWMNDPNGLVYFEGEYHLFYQYLPRRHWGHAVSTDLVHWAHLPIALSPDDLGEIFSGSAVVDTEDRSGFFGGRPGLVAIFTHNNRRQPPLGPQAQSLGYSSDRGRTWTKYAPNPVIPNPGIANFRDPKVFWHAATERWILVLACHDRVHFYRSRDLKEWTFASEFGAGQGAETVPWECPDLFELPVNGDPAHRKWVLQVSVHPRHKDTSVSDYKDLQYFIGEFDGVTFRNDNPPTTVLWTDFGKDNYAVMSWSDIPAMDGRRIWLGWMGNWDYAHDLPTGSWQGAMTLPRRVQLRQDAAGVRLTQTPVAELQRLRGQSAHWHTYQITPDNSLRVPAIGDAVELLATFELETADEWGVKIHSDATQYTTVAYDAGNTQILVDRTHSGQTAFSPAFSGTQRAPLAPLQGRVALHIFVDHSSIEVFGNDGEVVVTSLIFPDAAGADLDLEVYAVNGTVRLISLDVYRLHSIWPMDDTLSGSDTPSTAEST